MSNCPAYRCLTGCLIGSLLAVMAPAAAFASSPDDRAASLPLGSFVDSVSLEELSALVVTESKVAQSRKAITQKIAVLPEADFSRQPEANRNLAEVAQYVSGQFVNVLSRNDANWGSYAGLGPKYNSWLLDGLPIDSFIDVMSLDAAAIERVEIHKGPASVLYANYLSMDFAGNEAPLAGTTNLVLRNRIDKTLTRVSLGGGSWGGVDGRVYHQGAREGFSYFLGASTERADYTFYGVRGSWLQGVHSPDYEKTKLFGNLSFSLGRPDHTLSLFLHETRHAGSLGRPNRDYEHRYDTVNLSYSNALADGWNLQFKFGQRHYDRSYANDNWPAGVALTNVERTRQIIVPMDLTLSWQHAPGRLLTLGVDRQSVHYWTENRLPSGLTRRENDAEATSTGFFAQEKIQWKDWVVRAGVRHNHIDHDYLRLGGSVPATKSAGWQKNLWSLGVRHQWSPRLSFYANAGSSFMAPAAKQIGGTVAVPTASGELANPALGPESGVGRDLGLDWQAAPGLDVGLRVFDNRIGDAIVSSIVSAVPSQTRSENAGKARSTGVEFDLGYVVNDRFSAFANLTQTRTRVSNSVIPDQDGTAIPFAPRNIANAGVAGRLPWGMSVATYVHWVGRYYDSTSAASRQSFGNYGVINARVQQPLGRGVDLSVDLVNLGDRRYRMPFDFVAPGFNVWARLIFTY